MLVVLSLLLGGLIGLLQGGNINSLSLLYIRFGSLVMLALGLQLMLLAGEVIAPAMQSPAALAIHAISYLLVIGFFLLNRQVRRVSLVAGGLVLNLLAVAFNGGYMPVATAAFAGTAADVAASAQQSAGSALWFLGDFVAQPTGLHASAGDVLIAIGLGLITRELLLARSIRPQTASVRYRPKHLAGTIHAES